MSLPKVIVNGTMSPIAQPIELDYDPVRGLVYIQESISAGKNCGGLAGFYIANKVQFRMKVGGCKSSITATFSGGQGITPDNPQAHWEVMGNEIQKSIYESALAMTGVELFPSLLKDVRDGWQAIQSGDSVTEQDLRSSLDTGELFYYDILIGFLMRGQTHFATGQYVAKLTTSVSNFYGGDFFIGSSERIWSTSSLLTLGDPFTPSFVASQIISSVIPGDSHTGYAWGWRQLPPRAATGAQNRYEVSVEWWFEEWSTELYGSLI
jgi:hypothetical protein